MSWIGFFGLLVELVGFIILSLDLIPEYRLYRQRQLARAFRAALEDQKVWDELTRLWGSTSDDSPRGVIAQLLYRMQLQEVDALIRSLGLPELLSGPPERSNFLNASTAIHKALTKKESALAWRRRPPIGLGIALAVFGVLLQLISAWPGMPR